MVEADHGLGHSSILPHAKTGWSMSTVVDIDGYSERPLYGVHTAGVGVGTARDPETDRTSHVEAIGGRTSQLSRV